MANYSTPGVFIEEISTLGSSVASVPTAIPGFVGYTQKAVINGSNWPFTGAAPTPPTRITSLLEFEAAFGGPKNEAFDITLTGTVPSPTNISIAVTLSKNILYYQVQMFYANGGGTCYIVSAGLYSGTNPVAAELKNGMDLMEQIDEVTLLCAPESVFLLPVSNGEMKSLYDKMLAQCNKLQDRFAVMDVVHKTGNTIMQDASDFRNSCVGADNLKYGASYYPPVNTPIIYEYQNGLVTIQDDRGGAGTGPYEGKTLEVILNGAGLNSNVPPPDKALYNAILAELSKYRVPLSPSGAMLGVYARVDAGRGVWKAPANVGLAMANEPAIMITDAEQENLNIDPVSGKSINAIRQFTGRGTLAWGARTLAGNDNEWRYVNVRRLFTFVEESIKKATEFVVFEPNTASTWQRVKSMSEAFLTNIWRDGGLAGATTKDAFFVRVGLGTTMTPDDILNGKMIVEIGLAASRPAEFIILKFSHKLQES